MKVHNGERIGQKMFDELNWRIKISWIKVIGFTIYIIFMTTLELWIGVGIGLVLLIKSMSDVLDYENQLTELKIKFFSKN